MWKHLNTKYELRDADLFRMWSCTNCADVLREDNMTDLALAFEVETAQSLFLYNHEHPDERKA